MTATKTPDRTYLTPPEVARRWRCKPDKVRTIIESGDLPAFNNSLGKRRPRYLVALDDVERYELSRTVTPRPQASPRRRRRDTKTIKFF